MSKKFSKKNPKSGNPNSNYPNNLELSEHKNHITSIAFHPLRRLLAIGSDDNTVNVYEFLANGSNLRILQTIYDIHHMHQSIKFCPHYDILAIISNYNLTLWNYSSNAIIEKLSNIFYSVTFNPKLQVFVTGCKDNIKLWTFNSDPNSDLKISLHPNSLILSGNETIVRNVLFHPSNHLILASSSDANIIKLWKLGVNGLNATLLMSFNLGYKTSIYIEFCGIAPIMAVLMYGSGIKLFKFSSDYSSIQTNQQIIYSDNIDSVTFHPKAPFFAIGKNNEVILCEFTLDTLILKNRKKLQRSPIKMRGKKIVVFCPTDPLLAITEKDGELKLSEVNDYIRPNNLTNQVNQQFSVSNSNIRHNASLRDNAEPLDFVMVWFGKGLISQIKILSKFFTPTGESCPNFRDLYYSFMKTELPTEFIFKFEGQTGTDAGGLTKMVFDAILKVYIELFFEKIVNNDYLILKEGINLRQLIADTKKLILLANKANAKICLKIDPELLKLCESKYDDLMDYFNNTKSNLKKFYENINAAINTNNTYNELNNTTRSNFLVNKNEINKKKNLIKKYKELKQQKSNQSMINMLVKEIRMRRFAAKCGFKSWKQLENMCRFLEEIINYDPDPDLMRNNRNSFCSDVQLRDIALVRSKNGEIGYSLLKFFDFEPKFDKDTILLRVQLIQAGINQKIIDIKDISRELFMLYPALKPFIDYIIGPNSTDETRKKFVKFITGSEYSTDVIKMYLLSDEIPSNKRKNETIKFRLPFDPPSTCFSTISLLQRPTSGNYKNEFNEARIDDLILQSISTLSAKNGNNNEPENINNQFSRVRSGDSRIQIINEPSIENGLYINELSSVENGYNSQTSNNPNNHNDLSRNFGELRDPW
jgi:WD40 repeat protein